MSSPERGSQDAGRSGLAPCLALGVLGAVTACESARADEWSFAPTLSWSAIQNSNPRLESAAKSSASSAIVLDARLARAMENSEVYIVPHLRVERFTDPLFGNTDDISLLTGVRHEFERARLEASGSYADTNTLGTTIADTGLVLPDVHRRTAQGAFSYSYMLAEPRILFAELSYYDVSYYGDGSERLVGYRYPSVSLGERFVITDRLSVSLSAFGGKLMSDIPSNDSKQSGAQAGLSYLFSELTRFDGSFGSSSRTLAGQKSTGTVATMSLSHEMSRGRMSFGYTRNLVPYGYGVFVERQELTASGTWNVTPYIDATFTARSTRNDQAVSGLLADRKRYDDYYFALKWRFAQTWSLDASLVDTHAQVLYSTDMVDGWRAGLGVTWTPFPIVRSR